jgi:hypothetical protein
MGCCEVLQARQLHRCQVTQFRVLADAAMDFQKRPRFWPKAPSDPNVLRQPEVSLFLGTESEATGHDCLVHTRLRSVRIIRQILKVVIEVGEIVLAQCVSVEEEIQRIQERGLPAFILSGQDRLSENRNPGDVRKAPKSLDGKGTDLHARLNSTTMDGLRRTTKMFSARRGGRGIAP